MCFLDLSKLHMYKFHYDHIVKRYGSDAKLLFTDTDSLVYEWTNVDAYADMREHIIEYDTSDYPKSHFLYSGVNAKVLGKFKDECAWKAPLKFVGIRAKMYSLLLPENVEMRAIKGIKRSFVQKNICHKNFQDCLKLGKKLLLPSIPYAARGRSCRLSR